MLNQQQQQRQQMYYADQPLVYPGSNIQSDMNAPIFNQSYGSYPGQAPELPPAFVAIQPPAIPQPQAVAMPVDAVGHPRWADDLFHCHKDCNSLCSAVLFAPYRWAQTMQRASIWTFFKAILLFGLPWLVVHLCQGYVVMRYYRNINFTALHGVYNGNTEFSDYTSINPKLSEDIRVRVAINLALLFNLITFVISVRGRRRLREASGIPRSRCEDCCVHAFCSTLAKAQEARHVDLATGHMVTVQYARRGGCCC